MRDHEWAWPHLPGIRFSGASVSSSFSRTTPSSRSSSRASTESPFSFSIAFTQFVKVLRCTCTQGRRSSQPHALPPPAAMAVGWLCSNTYTSYQVATSVEHLLFTLPVVFGMCTSAMKTRPFSSIGWVAKWYIYTNYMYTSWYIYLAHTHCQHVVMYTHSQCCTHAHCAKVFAQLAHDVLRLRASFVKLISHHHCYIVCMSQTELHHSIISNYARDFSCLCAQIRSRISTLRGLDTLNYESIIYVTPHLHNNVHGTLLASV